ncbi:ribosomal-processing cysteine protease Prp [Peptostreptococcus equinus]|uniref:Ribosomal processing cysteine protease Prp n=1 Tax=Peptostreptococcus equinus TaxID=3003601 RepID=A0ABY7JQJ4_9FIRM|nr:ribosomal-processing cysteine protease Prp [Peptostreptococcus sp. CBA3647]WAW14313.1 ribosomal-processing cysteine protease Prp [Peptostreptococcus sp. CBA3647]
MIKVDFYYNSEFKIKGFELRGHANYEEFGYDIVCASVTSNSIAVINSLENLQKVNFEKVLANEGHILCKVADEDLEKSQLLLEHLKLALVEISREYPKNIKIFEK